MFRGVTLTASNGAPPLSSPVPRLRFDAWHIHTRARREIVNWPTAYWLAASKRWGWFRPKGRDILLRGDGSLLPQVTPGEARFVLASIYAASAVRLEEGVTFATSHLLELNREVSAKLMGTYSESELRLGVTGGWPGLKEVILYTLIRKTRPDLVVETGVAQGVSTTFILDALERNGKGTLLSIDLPRREGDPMLRVDPTLVKGTLSPGWLVPARHRGRWELELGPAELLLPKIGGRPDLFCHDSLHTHQHMLFEFRWALENLSRGGVLVGDDIELNDAFGNILREANQRLVPICTRGVGVALKVS